MLSSQKLITVAVERLKSEVDQIDLIQPWKGGSWHRGGRYLVCRRCVKGSIRNSMRRLSLQSLVQDVINEAGNSHLVTPMELDCCLLNKIVTV
jgi:hypothetical protein